MAHSLVKNDEDHKGTIALWKDFFAFLDKEYPAAVMVSEWGEADKSLEAGFQMDFVLHFGPSHYNDLFRCAHPFFAGDGDASAFVRKYLESMEKSGHKGLICIPSGNHDMDRLARTIRGDRAKIAFAFLLSMPGAPFIYYGDEIGMKYVEGLKSVEGGYVRTGSRSPMAFDTTANAGFSAAKSSMLYIAQDESKSYINAQTELADENSLLNEVRRLLSLRKSHSALGATAKIELLQLEKDSYPLVYKRESADETVFALFNPVGQESVVSAAIPDDCEILYTVGKSAHALKRNASGALVLPPACAVFLKK